MNPRTWKGMSDQKRVKSLMWEIQVTFKDNLMGNEEQHTYRYPEEMETVAMSQIVNLLKQKCAVEHSNFCQMEVSLSLVER